MKKLLLTAAAIAAVILTTSLAASADSEAVIRRWFPESGHWVEGDFLGYYESIPAAEQIFGYPISEKISDPLTGLEIQYFERARFETSTAGSQAGTVQLTNLGTLLYTPGTAHQLDYSPSACSVISSAENPDFEVCYSFLTFYETFGGETIFGRPISNLEFSEERIVQYFEKARLEWHPELPPGSRVVIDSLGQQYLDLRGESNAQAAGISPIKSVLSLNAAAFTARPSASDGEEQSVFVIVENQNGEPVEGVQVKLLISYPSGQTVSGILEPTDVFGVSDFSFTVQSESLGLTVIQVEATNNVHTAYTRTSFRIWW